MRITVHSLRFATKHQWFRVVSFRKFVGRVRRVGLPVVPRQSEASFVGGESAAWFVPVARSTVALVMCQSGRSQEN